MSMLVNMSDAEVLGLMSRVHDKVVSPEGALRELKHRSGQRIDDEMSSTSDERVDVANNIVRHNYRRLSAEEATQMQAVKDLGLRFIRLLHDIGGTPELVAGRPGGQASRCLSVSQTKIEEAVMWAVKEITG